MTEIKQPTSALSSPRFCNMGTFMRMQKVDSAEGLDFVIAGAPFDTASSFRLTLWSQRNQEYLSHDEAQQCNHAGKYHGWVKGRGYR